MSRWSSEWVILLTVVVPDPHMSPKCKESQQRQGKLTAAQSHPSLDEGLHWCSLSWGVEPALARTWKFSPVCPHILQGASAWQLRHPTHPYTAFVQALPCPGFFPGGLQVLLNGPILFLFWVTAWMSLRSRTSITSDKSSSNGPVTQPRSNGFLQGISASCNFTSFH